MPDGRRLGYAEYGLRGGTPILHFHGLPGGRFYDLDTVALRTAGAWLLTVERPGIGLSDPKPERTLLDWVDDITAFADRMSIDRFAVLGTSAGAPYALAAGHALPGRVTAVGVQCGALEMPGDPESEALSPLRDQFALYRNDPVAFRRMTLERIRPRAESWADDPDGFFDEFLDRWPPKDRPAFVANRDLWMRILAATYGNSPDADEDEIYCRPWGFAPEDIATPVHAWHGQDDQLAPVAAARYTIGRIPSGQLTIYPGEGHYLAREHHSEYVEFLTGR
jgi:pimeloyl-ACP methyl ester carboxylesterase